MYAIVLILNSNASNDLILTYKIREGIICLPGMLFLVPVKNQQVSGLVLRLQKQYHGDFNLRYLGSTLEPQPILSRRALALARWLSRHYVCGLNRAISLFLPPPVRSKPIYRYFVLRATDMPQEDEQFSMLESKWHFLWAALVKAGKRGMRTERIKTRWDQATLQQVELWYQQGYLRRTETWEQGHQDPLQDALANPLTGNFRHQLEPLQQAAFDRINADLSACRFGHHLLFGVTGSGKTEVYMQAAEQAIRQGRQVIYLVPEISLVPQIAATALQWFGEGVAVLHSNLTPAQRYQQWQRIRLGDVKLIIGPRSAIFAPVAQLGLIIIDEEHEHTYKQNEPEPRYDARDTAEFLARLWKAVVLRGSATPDIGTFYRVQKAEIQMSRLPDRIQNRQMPAIHWIDMKKEMREGHPYPVSRPLLQALEQTLQKGEQAILLMNRRGFHTYVLCKDCGQRLDCPRCSVALTFHRQGSTQYRQAEPTKTRLAGSLVCHYCDFRQGLPDRCPHCGSTALQYMGTGTERVVDYLSLQLPQAKILRMDFDSTRRAGSHTEILRSFQNGEGNVLVGTQMVAKGFDFANVTLAAVLHIDGVLNIPDYSSSEKAFQIMVQTAGRAGRGKEAGQVMIQTFFPENPVLHSVEAYDYEGFYENEIALRQALGYPPVQKMARILLSGRQEELVFNTLSELQHFCQTGMGAEADLINWLGPANAPLERVKDRWRCHVVLVSSHFAALRRCLSLARTFPIKEEAGLRLILDMEPKTLL